MKRKILYILLLLLSIIAVFLVLSIFRDEIEFGLIGDESITVLVGSEYSDEGYFLKNRGKEVPHNQYKVNINSTLDTNVLGDYTYEYKIEYKKEYYSLVRNIKVIDNTAPIITTNLEEVIRDYCTKKDDVLLTYSAIDNYDGDISDKIELSEHGNKITLTVKDSSDNIETKEINIKYTKKPSNKFYLNGNSKTYVAINGIYNEAGASYKDGCGNTITNDITISGSVDTSIKGEYEITYEVDGQKLTRKVSVYEPSEVSETGKVIYLTFDDGPGYYTRSILNTLNKYNVKATFFVTSQFPNYLSLIQDEYNAGHKVAAHTYTHNYNVYSSLDAYLDDFNKINEVIKTYTGEYTRLFRFPGGSSNTISRSYKNGIVTEIANRMTEDGYVYFDWNVDSTDAAGSSSNTIYNKVVNGVKNCNKCVVLMHDIKGTTASALDSMLNTLINNGYYFSVLDENSPIVHHKINN